MNHLCERVLLRTLGVLITCCITVIKCLAEKRQGLFQLMIPEGFIFAARKTWKISSDHRGSMLQRLFTLQQYSKPRAGQKPGARLEPPARPHFQRGPQIALPPEDQDFKRWAHREHFKNRTAPCHMGESQAGAAGRPSVTTSEE